MIKKTPEEMMRLWQKDVEKNPFLMMDEVKGRIFNLPLCPKCQKPAFRDKGYKAQGIVQCTNTGCGWKGPIEKTNTVQARLREVILE
jgi:ribosomal protein L37AE/L43A